MADSKKKEALVLLITFVLLLGILLHFCAWKQGMFIDEIFTYGLSNSHYMPFIGNGADDRLAEQLITREDFFDYLAVTGTEDSFDVGSVYYNQGIDVHPPLHYWLINLASSLAPNQFSKWIGLVPGLILYLGTLFLLYLLCMELFGRFPAALAAVVLYGLSAVGLSTMLMIRMYVLLGFLTVLLALITAKELRSPDWKKELGIGLSIFLGLLTQYYFVFYAFFLCASVVFRFLFHRQWKPLIRFTLCAFSGVGLMLLVFPAAISQLTADRLVSGGNAIENLGNLSAWPGRLRYYFGQIRHGMPAAVISALLALLLSVLFSKDLRCHPELRCSRFWILFLPLIPTVFVAAVISPVVEGRYIYNIMPICALAAPYCFYLLGRTRLSALKGLAAVPICLSLFFALRCTPDYIYEEHRDYNLLLGTCSEAPCVYLTEYFAGVTQDMLQLMQFDDVYVSGNPESPALLSYLDGAERCVVYVDVDSYWGSGFDPLEMMDTLLQETDFSEYQELYRYGLSDTFLLRK